MRPTGAELIITINGHPKAYGMCINPTGNLFMCFVDLRLIKHWFRKALLPAILVGLSACSPPTDQPGARLQLIQNSFFRIIPDNSPPPTPEQEAQYNRNVASSVSISGSQISFSPQTLINAMKTAPGPKDEIVFGPGLLSSSVNVNGKGCVGDSGSLLPPLSLSTCATAALNLPFTVLYDFQSARTGQSHRLHVGLNGIEQFYVPQAKDNYCWAASLETARSFLHLPAIPLSDTSNASEQQKLVDLANSQCKVPEDQMPSMYQIADVINYVEANYDKAHPIQPKLCTDAECIISSVYNQQPVIMLLHGEEGKGHAVLVVGVDYDTGMAQGQRVYIPRTFSVLDPADKPRRRTVTLWEACRADAFISY